MSNKIKNFLENILCNQFKSLLQNHHTNLRKANQQLIEKTKQIENLEQALNAAKIKYENSFNTCNMGKTITFMSGNMEVNECFRKMLGYGPKDFYNLKWQDITHPEDIHATQKMINDMVAGNIQTQQLTKRYIHQNGSIVWVDTCSCIQRDLNGNAIYFVSTINDVTRHKEQKGKTDIPPFNPKLTQE